MGDRITAPTVAAIGGSERVGGNTDQVLDRLVRLLDQRGVTTTVIQLRDLDMTGGCGACGDCNTRDVHCGVQDGVSAAVQTMRSADGVLYATPVHGFGMASLMQGFIERAGVGYLRFDRPLAGKAGLAVVTGRQFALEQVHNQLISNMLLNRMVLAGSGFPALVHGGAPGSIWRDTEGVAHLDAAVDRFAELLWFLARAADLAVVMTGQGLATNERAEVAAKPTRGASR